MKLNRLWFKILAVVMAIVVVFVPMLSLFATAQEIQRTVPNIEVHGFMASKLYADKDDPNSTVIWPPDTTGVMKEKMKELREIAPMAFSKDWMHFGEEISRMINETLFPVYIGTDGEVHDKSGVYFVYPEPEEITMDCEVQFTYDWRTDPVLIASKLNDFVNYVLECSGSDQVTIECHSLGGAIVTSYLSIYGCEKVKGVAFNSTAVFGSSFVSEMLSGDVKFDGTALQEYLYFAFDYNQYHHLLNGLINFSKKIGLLDFLAKQSNTILSLIGDIVAYNAIVPMFGNWLTIWAMVPNDEFDYVYDKVFNQVYAGEDHSALTAKIEKYNELVRYKKADVIRELNKKANVYVISRYGYSSVPAIESYDSISDGIIDVKYSSFGATTSLYGQALQNEYLMEIPPKYIAPNKSIDASTCMFPDQTWFVYSMRHFKSPEPLAEFIDMLLAYDGQATIQTFPEYPRYLAYNALTDSITVDTTSGIQKTFFPKFWIVVKELWLLITRPFRRVK